MAKIYIIDDDPAMDLLTEGFRYRGHEAPTLKAQKSFLREGVELGMFPKEAAGVIDAMYAP